MATPRPDIVDDIPKCSKRCAHYRHGEGGHQPPVCEETTKEWPWQTPCWPEIKRLVREARK